jgi:hypothetical protein
VKVACKHSCWKSCRCSWTQRLWTRYFVLLPRVFWKRDPVLVIFGCSFLVLCWDSLSAFIGCVSEPTMPQQQSLDWSLWKGLVSSSLDRLGRFSTHLGLSTIYSCPVSSCFFEAFLGVGLALSWATSLVISCLGKL